MKSPYFSTWAMGYLLIILSNIILTFAIKNNQFNSSQHVNNFCEINVLLCGLNKERITISETCFMVEKQEFCLKDFICTGFQLGGLRSQYIPLSSLAMELQDLEFTCSGKWNYGKLDGSLVATIYNTDISTSSVIEKDMIFPKSFVFPTCSIPHMTIDVKFNGGLVGFMLQLISGFVEDVVKNALYNLICKKLEPNLSTSITDAFSVLNPKLLTLISHGPSSPPNLHDDFYIDWNTIFSSLIDDIFDNYATKVLDVITEGTGILQVDLSNLTIMLPIFSEFELVQPLKLVFHSFELSGLESLHNISLHGESASIWSTLWARSLTASLRVTIFDPNLGHISPKPFLIEFALGETYLGCNMFIPVSRIRFEELYLHQRLNIDCLLSATDALSVLSLIIKTEILNIRVISEDLENDLEMLVNNALKLATSVYQDLLRDLISGIAQGPLKSLINRKLEDFKTSSKCLPPIPNNDSVPNYVVWQESKGLHLVDYFLNTVLGVAGLNKLITNATGGTGTFIIPVASADLSISGLNTFYQFLVLTPSPDLNLPYNLNSLLSIGYCEGHKRNQICTPVSFSLQLNSSSHTQSFSANLYNLEISLSLLAKLDRNDLVADMFPYSGNHSGCFLSSFDVLQIDQFEMSISEATVTKGEHLSKDVTDIVKRLISALTSDDIVYTLNQLLLQLLSDAEVACETGNWPIPHIQDDDYPVPVDDCNDPVHCGLSHIVIGPLPDLCLNMTSNFLLCLQHFSCHHIDLNSIESENLSPRTLMLGVKDFEITCDGNIFVEANPPNFPYSFNYEGSIAITMTNFSGSVDLIFGATPSTPRYPPIPDSLSFASCQINDTNIEVSIKGGIIGAALDELLSGPLEEALEGAIYWALCDVLNPFVGHVVTKILKEKIDPKIQLLIDMSIPPPPVILPGYLQWNNTLLGKLHHIIDFIKVNEAQVLRCMKRDLGQGGNSVIDILSDGTGELDIGLNIPIYFGEFTVLLKDLRISGLNSLGDLGVLYPSLESGVTLSSTVDFDHLELELSILVKDSYGVYEQDAVLDLTLKNVTANFDIVVALRLSVLNALYSDQLLRLPCLMSALDEIFINSLILDLLVDNLSITQVSSGDATPLEEDVADLFTHLFDTLLTGYPLMITDVIAGIIQGPVKRTLNEKIADIVFSYQSNHICATHENYTDVNWIEWPASSLIQKIDLLLNEILGTEGINEFIGCVTNHTGAFSFTFPDSSPIFANWKVSLGGLDSFSNFALLYPLIDAPYDLANSLSFGDCSSSGSCHNFTIGLEGLENNGEFSRVLLEFSNLKIFLDFLLELDFNSLMNLRYEDLHSKGCFLSTIDQASFRDLSIVARSVKFYFLNGSSMIDLSFLVNKVFSHLSDPETLAKLDERIQSYLENAYEFCIDGYVPNSVDDDYTSSSSSTLLSWKLKIVVCIICTLFCGYLLSKLLHSFGIVYVSGDKHNSDIFEASPSIQSAIFLSNAWWTLHVKKLFCRKLANDSDENDDTMADEFIYDALIASDSLSPFIRISIPIVIAALAVAFVFSLLNPAANVMMEIRAGNIILGDAAIFNFGYGGTVHDLWVADAYFLSILIALFTGVWPFIKLVLLLLAWVLPTSIFLLEYRDLILRWVDILGKWSLVDTYVMVLMMVAFHVKFSVVPGVTIALTVSPQWQFYTFLGATMGSLVVGHIALGCHRAVSETPILVDRSKEESSESLMNHSFNVNLLVSNTSKTDNELLRRKISFTTSGKIFVFLFLSMGLFLVVNGTLIKSVTFELKGLTGYLMKDPISSYSLLEVGLDIPPSSGMPSSFGVRFIQFAYFLFSITIPIAFVFMLIILWIIPFKLSTQKSVILNVEMLNAWSALDVFVLSIIASVLEIKQYAKFLIGDHCDAINEVLHQEMDSELNGDDTCFDVVARMKTDSTVVCIAAIFLIVVGLPYISLCHQTVAERLDDFNTGKENNSVDEWIHHDLIQERKTSMSSIRSFNNSIEKRRSENDENNSLEISYKLRIMSSIIHGSEYIGLISIHDEQPDQSI